MARSPTTVSWDLWYPVALEELDRVPRSRLKLSGVIVWRPRRVERRIVDGTWSDTGEDLTPGYALLSSFKGWSHIEVALGVRVLRVGGKPEPLSVEEVADLRVVEQTETFIQPSLFPGQGVRIRAGARSSFAGMRGVFRRAVSVRGGVWARVDVLVAGLRELAVSVPIDYVEAL